MTDLMRSSIKFGLLGMCAIASVGCSTHSTVNYPTYAELETFRVDCNIKQQQVEYLQSLRSTKYQRQVAALTSPVDVTRYAMPSRYTNALINDKLRLLARECAL